MNKAALKDMTTIVVRLTLTCLVAAFVMGLTFVLTHDAKEKNEQLREERVMYGILGYDKKHPAPDTMVLNTVYRYVVTKGEQQSIAYVLPEKSGKNIYVELDLSGNFVTKMDLPIDAVKIRNRGERDAVVHKVSGADEVRYADNVIIVTDKGKRAAYILDGIYPGFKTTIRVKMALDAQFTMLGFEVLEHEEDPGLGGEIEQKWFRGQFEGKTAQQLQDTNVVRLAMPDDFRRALEGKIKEEDADKIRAEHRADDIYALTGATISSRAVLEGNKSMVRKFVYRIQVLDKALSSQNISSNF